RPGRVPLSFAQQRMWFINQLEPDLPTYNIPAVFDLSGNLDVDALRAATADVVARHEVLRTVFPAVDGQPFQSVTPIDEIEGHMDWHIVGTPEELQADLRRGFDVSRQLPLRARLLRTGPDRATFAIVAHHIAFDGQSFGPLAADLLRSYACRL